MSNRNDKWGFSSQTPLLPKLTLIHFCLDNIWLQLAMRFTDWEEISENSSIPKYTPNKNEIYKFQKSPMWFRPHLHYGTLLAMALWLCRHNPVAQIQSIATEGIFLSLVGTPSLWATLARLMEVPFHCPSCLYARVGQHIYGTRDNKYTKYSPKYLANAFNQATFVLLACFPFAFEKGIPQGQGWMDSHVCKFPGGSSATFLYTYICV